MRQDIEDIQRELDNFKINTLLQLHTLETKANIFDKEEKTLKYEIKAIEIKLTNDLQNIDNEFKAFKKDLPRQTTSKIAFTILGATVSFLFASVLRYMEHLF